MSRYDLPDFERRVIAPLLPNKPQGVPRVDDRRVPTFKLDEKPGDPQSHHQGLSGFSCLGGRLNLAPPWP